MTGGGITALDSRTRDADGAAVIAFTEPHIEFRQSLLVRSADAERIRSHGDLHATDRVGVLASTTGEARLLQLLDITDDGRIGITHWLADNTVFATRARQWQPPG